MGERRVAGAEDSVGRALDAELFLQRRLDVDVAEDAEPLALEKKDRKYIVTARVTGTFPGSPVDLKFAFTLERGKIATLEITP